MLRKIYKNQLTTVQLTLAIAIFAGLTYIFGSLAIDSGKIIYWLLTIIMLTETIDLIVGLVIRGKSQTKKDARARTKKKRTA